MHLALECADYTRQRSVASTAENVDLAFISFGFPETRMFDLHVFDFSLTSSKPLARLPGMRAVVGFPYVLHRCVVDDMPGLRFGDLVCQTVGPSLLTTHGHMMR